MTDHELMTVTEVADLLRVRPETIRRWIGQGTIRAAQVGRSKMIRRQDIDHLLSASTAAQLRAELNRSVSAPLLTDAQLDLVRRTLLEALDKLRGTA